jgi:hypothetical protein
VRTGEEVRQIRRRVDPVSPNQTQRCLLHPDPDLFPRDPSTT